MPVQRKDWRESVGCEISRAAFFVSNSFILLELHYQMPMRGYAAQARAIETWPFLNKGSLIPWAAFPGGSSNRKEERRAEVVSATG